MHCPCADVGKADSPECLSGAVQPIALGDAAGLEAECNIFRDAHVREERVMLKHHTEAATLRGLGADVARCARVIFEHDPSTIGTLVPSDHAQGCRLT